MGLGALQRSGLKCLIYPPLFPSGGETVGDKIYFADSGSSLKVLEWKTGQLSKVPNHEEDFGFTDCLSETGDLLVVSSYDLDTGCLRQRGGWIVEDHHGRAGGQTLEQ